MISTRSFLEAILPVEGYKCAAIFKNGQVIHRWTKDVGELESILVAEDHAGNTVYHGCASYRSPDRRTGANAFGARSLWLDVDAGEGKPYPDAKSAAKALLAFCDIVGLPPPLLVGSGSGVHGYFPLDRTIAPEDWLTYAHGLKYLARLHGLEADPARTADIASILRPPGTHNRKRGEKLVECGPLRGPYPLDRFASLRMGSMPGGNPSLQRERSAPLAPRASQLLASIASAQQPSFSERVADRCAQVDALRTSGGRLPEPEWYAALGVLAFTVDGDHFGHEWSKGYEGYSAKETQARLDRSRGLSGATTCDRFSGLSRRCDGCPFAGKIKSPIVLGYEENDAIPTAPAMSEPSSVPQTAEPEALVAAPLPPGAFELPTLPEGFRWSGSGQLTFVTSNKKEVEDPVVISDNPLYLESVGRAEVSTDTFSYNFRHYLPLEGWRDITIPAKRMMGNEGISEMFSKGAVIHDRDLFRRFLIASIDDYNRRERLLTKYEQFGWKDDEKAFLWGTQLYTATEVKSAAGTDDVRTMAQHLRPAIGGSLDKWSAAASTLFAQGCEPQAFVLLCAFAAPLMRFHTGDEGGGIVHLTSRDSATGKTTALIASAGVWGRYSKMVMNNFDTRVAKGVTQALMGNLPAYYDEISDRDPEVLREFVQTFTVGRDRLRGTQDGGIHHREQRWCTILMTNSNRSLVELVRRNDTDAMGFRILEFETSLPKGLKNGDLLKKTLEANYGYAGDTYLRYLLQPEALAWTKRAVTEWTDRIWEKTGLSPEHRFWVRTLGSVSVAAHIVRKLNLLSFSPDRIMDWALDQVVADKDDAPITGRAVTTAVSILSEFINEHLQDILTVAGPWQPGPGNKVAAYMKPLRRAFIRYEAENRRWVFAKKPLLEWLERKDIPYKRLMTELEKEKIVTRRDFLAKLSAGTDVPGTQTTCIEANGNHPMLSGALEPIEKFYTGQPEGMRRKFSPLTR